MIRIHIEPSLQFVWALANAEACFAGRAQIDPGHFLLALLRVLDNIFRQEAEQLSLPPEAMDDLTSFGERGRSMLGCDPETLTAVRRRLSNTLRDCTVERPLTMLHRSEPSRELFRVAGLHALEAGTRSLGPDQLLHEILQDPPPAARAILNEAKIAAGGTGKRKLPHSQEADWLDLEAGGGDQPDPTAEFGKLGRDLTALARQGRLPAITGRRQEIKQLLRFMTRTTKPNVILVGEAGVGKTAVVEGLARHLAGDGIPEDLRRLHIFELNVVDLMAGTRYRGDLEQRLQELMATAAKSPDLVLFIDEIHLVMAGGSGAPDVANALKPALARGELRCIGATTNVEYERHLQQDPAFTRRFQILHIEEPTREDSLEILKTWATRIEKHQQVMIDEVTVTAALDLTLEHLPNSRLPDKAIDLLENAATFVKVDSLSTSVASPSKEPPSIGVRHLLQALEEIHGIVVREGKGLDLDLAGQILRREIVGQGAAVTTILQTLKDRTTVSEGDQRALAVLLLHGPSGIGKSHTATLLARALAPRAGDPPLLRLTMSEYKERHELARLSGAPPGFIGHENQGELFRFADAHTRGLVLLDEMEKAHPEVQDFFLGIFDTGQGRDSRGRQHSFRQFVFVMTCNLESGDGKGSIGFERSAAAAASGPGTGADAFLARRFRKEFLGRVDRIVGFGHLDEAALLELYGRRIGALAAELETAGVVIAVDDAVRERLCRADRWREFGRADSSASSSASSPCPCGGRPQPHRRRPARALLVDGKIVIEASD